MGFPSKKRIEKALKILNPSTGTLALNEGASPLEKFRWEICQHFVRYVNEKSCTQKALAEKLGIDEAKVSKILHHRIQEFSTDRLLLLYEKINPNMKIKVG